MKCERKTLVACVCPSANHWFNAKQNYASQKKHYLLLITSFHILYSRFFLSPLTSWPHPPPSYLYFVHKNLNAKKNKNTIEILNWKGSWIWVNCAFKYNRKCSLSCAALSSETDANNVISSISHHHRWTTVHCANINNIEKGREQRKSASNFWQNWKNVFMTAKVIKWFNAANKNIWWDFFSAILPWEGERERIM